MKRLLLAASLAWLPVDMTVAQAPPVDPWLARMPAAAFDTQRGPDAAFRIDVPKANWFVLPASRSAAFIMAARKGDADITVERTPLSLALTREDVTDVLAQIQADGVRDREPRASDFEARVLEVGDRRLVAVQYRRPAAAGTERVRQYSVPVGRWLYHITCAASLAQFPAYEATFAHIASTFSAVE